MKRTFHGGKVLLRLPLFAALGLAVFLVGWTYSHAHTWLREHIEFDWKAPPVMIKYTGPQNAQELMKALDEDYNNGCPKIEVSISKITGIETKSYRSNFTTSEIDARYPRDEWLQILLDRGIIIENFHEYVSHLSKRHTLALLEDNPDLRQSGILDIPPTDDWETYKAAYINKLANDHAKLRETVEQIERGKKAVERAKAQIERAKAQTEHSKEHAKLAIERSKEQIERAKVQIEHSKKQVERAQKALNSQQLEHVRKQLEHARKQIARTQEALERPKEPMPPQEPMPPDEPN